MTARDVTNGSQEGNAVGGFDIERAANRVIVAWNFRCWTPRSGERCAGADAQDHGRSLGVIWIKRLWKLTLQCLRGNVVLSRFANVTERATAQSGRLLLHEATPGEMRLCTHSKQGREAPTGKHTHR